MSRPVTTRITRTKAETKRYQRERDLKNAVFAATRDAEHRVQLAEARVLELEAENRRLNDRMVGIGAIMQVALDLAKGVRRG